MNGGRPLRFLGVTLGGWVVVRTAILWPVAGPVPALIRAIAPPLAAQTPVVESAAIPPERRAIRVRIAGSPRQETTPPPPLSIGAARVVSVPSARFRTAQTAPVRRTAEAGATVQPPPLAPTPPARPPGRLAGSIWLIAREGQGAARPGSQLGGSQAGARLTYALGDARRVALAARISAPLSGRGAEVALGVDWRPTSLPIHLVAEQRIGLDGAPGGATAFVIGGLDPTPVAAGFRLEAYGQAGVIARRGGQGFADGAARLTHPVARVRAIRLDLGVGAWGGAQPGATRLDVGPSVAAAIPIGGRAVRVTLDWRRRIVGKAAPGSGPALSIGGDF